MAALKKKERALGKAEGKRRYDLPLNRNADSGFLTLLIALMTFLAVLALAASFCLSAMTERWSSGMESKMTVEIPAITAAGSILPRDEIRNQASQIARMLEQHPAIDSAHILSDDEIGALIEPWLGKDLPENVPLPGLITLQTNNLDSTALGVLEGRIKSVAPQASIDTHEEWLNDLLRFTRALQFAAAILTLIIAATTATAVSGAVRARMAVYADEVRLLHLMGAADAYISRQFQRHSLLLALQGGIAGLIAGGITLALIGWIAGEAGVNLLPDFRLDIPQYLGIAVLPLIAGAIAGLTAGRTVNRELARMP